MKPGYQTTEFWMTLIAQLVNALVQSGLIGDGTQLVKGLAFAAAAITTVTYAITRAQVKVKTAEKSEPVGPDPQAGFTTVYALVLMLGIALLAMAVTSCTQLKSEAKHASADVVDCMKPQLVDRSAELGGVLEQAVTSLLSDTGKVDRAGFKSLTQGLKSDAAGCAIATVIAHLSKPRDQGAPLASPLAVDVPDLEAAWADTRRANFGGRAFFLGNGS